MSKSEEVVKTSRPWRVNETSTGKRADSRYTPYKKSGPKTKGGEEETRPKFRVSYKELIATPKLGHITQCNLTIIKCNLTIIILT